MIRSFEHLLSMFIQNIFFYQLHLPSRFLLFGLFYAICELSNYCSWNSRGEKEILFCVLNDKIKFFLTF